MPEITQYTPGNFCWYELATSDSDAAKKFYSELFGWTAHDTSAGPDMVYTMLQLNGKDVGALYQLTEQHKSQGVPPHWETYISVANADESAARAKELGGVVVMEPFDVMEVGRMALVQDPTGAMFAIWQARANIGAGLKDEPNTFCWSELWTTDTAKAAEFYTGLFGWEAKSSDAGDMPYTEFVNDGRSIGGMLGIPPEWGPIPSHWLGYVAVEDCDDTAEKAKSLGAEIKLPPTDIPNVGRFAMIQDPQGAAIEIIKLNLQEHKPS